MPKCVHFGDCYAGYLSGAKSSDLLMDEEEFQEVECGNRFPWCETNV